MVLSSTSKPRRTLPRMSEGLKGRYSPIPSPSYTNRSKQLNVFPPKSSTLGSWFREATLLVAGVLSMLAHHWFYSYLDGTSIRVVPVEMRGIGFSVRYQSVASGIGNAIAYIARAVLSTIIGMVFIQVAWLKLRGGHYSVKLIDALLECKAQPFTKSALPAWYFTFSLAAIASMSSLMALISIIAPGSLQIVTSDVSSPCTVRTVSLNTSNIADESVTSNGSFSFTATQPPIIKLAGRVLMAGAPLPPDNPCSDAGCNYQITFDAPVVDCKDVDSDFNLTSWLPPPFNSTSAIPVWSASSWHDGSQFVAASRNLDNHSTAAVNCTSYKAKYIVDISHSNTTASTSHIVTAVPYELTYTSNTTSAVDAQYDSVTTAFAQILGGTVRVDPLFSGSIYGGDNGFVGMCPAFSGSAKSSWSPTADLATEISSFMQNLSVSLLSDQLSEEGVSPTVPFSTTCHTPTSTFKYQRMQLLTVYGAALGITLLCMLIGARAKHLNGVEESFLFSRIVGAVLNDSLFEGRDTLTESSKLTAAGSATGQLQLVSLHAGSDANYYDNYSRGVDAVEI